MQGSVNRRRRLHSGYKPMSPTVSFCPAGPPESTPLSKERGRTLYHRTLRGSEESGSKVDVVALAGVQR
ncbi:hypothetical protein [[Eubacterium] cellulosolvens]